MSEEQGMKLRCIFYDSDASEVELRQVYFGLEPAILIEPGFEGNDLVLNVAAVDMDADELASMLETIASTVREASADG